MSTTSASLAPGDPRSATAGASSAAERAADRAATGDAMLVHQVLSAVIRDVTPGRG